MHLLAFINVDEIVVSALLVTLIALTLLLLRWRGRRALQAWADRHGYTIVGKEKSSADEWADGRRDEDDSRFYYRLTVQNAEGQTRRCWACVGHGFWGLWSSRVEVSWETLHWE